MAGKQGQSGDKRREFGIRRAKKPGWKEVFLAELEKWGVVDHAIRQAGVASSTAYKAREVDPKFREAWDEAEGKLLATAEVVARQRAVVGTQRPVYFQGRKVDSILEVDNAHLRWLLAKLKPQVYGEKIDLNMNHSGEVEVHVYLPDNAREAEPEATRNGHDPAARGATGELPSNAR